MGGKDGEYDVLLRGETRESFMPGRWVFIQRETKHGGGFWFHA